MKAKLVVFYYPYPTDMKDYISKTEEFADVEVFWEDGFVFVHKDGNCIFASNLPCVVEFQI